MPLYDFECKCGHVVEDVLQITTQFNEIPCPACKTGTARRLPAAPAVHFRGYGFTPKHYSRGLIADNKQANDTLEETDNGQLRRKSGAGHDA